MRKAYNGMRADEAVENILNMFARTKNNKEYIATGKENIELFIKNILHLL